MQTVQFQSTHRTVCPVKKTVLNRTGLSVKYFQAGLFFIFFFLSSLALSAQNTWTGASNNNWNRAQNWSLNHVPDITEDVIVPGGGTVKINVNTNAECKSMEINSGSGTVTITINSGRSLTIANDLVMNGSTGAGKDNVINVGGQELNAGSITMTNVGSSKITSTNGDITVTGNITMNGSSTDNQISFTTNGNLTLGGDMDAGGSFVPGYSTVTMNGGNTQHIGGSTTQFYNLTINKTSNSNTVYNSTNALTISNTFQITKGVFVASATDNNFTVGGNLNVSANGTLTHDVDWDMYGRLMSLGSNVNIDGKFLYLSRSHVQLNATSSATVRTGSDPASGFSILTMRTADYYASGQLRVDDNCWAMFSTSGSFHTNGNNVYAYGALLNAGGTLYVDGGSLNVSGGAYIGYTLPGAMNISSGTFNVDNINIGNGTTAGTINQSGGTTNISWNLLIDNFGTYQCTGSPAINISGDWTNNNDASGFIPASSTVTFKSTSSAQLINGSASAQNFGNLTITKGIRTLTVSGSTTSLGISGNLLIGSGTFNSGTAANIAVGGNWTHNGANFIANSGTVTFAGSSAQSLDGSTQTNFNKVVINNPAGVNLSTQNMMITNNGAGALDFQDGRINTGTKLVMINNYTGTITNAGPGKYVNGYLRLGSPTGSPTRVYDIGDATSYTPVAITFNNVTAAGYATVNTTAGDHPNITTSMIDETKSVNRFWNIVNNGLTVRDLSVKFNFVSGDLDAGANPSIFVVGRYTSFWSYPTLGTKNPLDITATVTGFGVHAIGEMATGVPSIVTQPSDWSTCGGTSTTLTASAFSKPNCTAVWEYSTDGGSTFMTLPMTGSFSSTSSISSNITTTILTIDPVSMALNGYSFRAVFSNSRGTTPSFDAILTVNPAPTVDAGPDTNPICGAGPSEPLGGTIGGSATTGTWSSDVGGSFNPSATTLNATWTPPVGFYGIATLTLTASGGGCPAVIDSKTQSVSPAVAPVTISPASSTICVNDIQKLEVTSTLSHTQNSGTINLSIPDHSAAGRVHTINLSGIPSGAMIANVRVTFNVTHPRVRDLIVNLTAPNGNTINLADRINHNGANFTNTTVSSASTTAFTSSTPPYSGTFEAMAVNGIGATGYISNTTNFNNLFSNANGNWTLSIRDDRSSNTGTLNSWSIVVEYTDPITWGPVTHLYKDASATTPYTGGITGTVYYKSDVPESATYTATAAGQGGCTASATTTVTSGPIVSIAADYCYGGGKIQLTATSVPPASSWSWNTGETTPSILIDIAGLYTATATTAAGCVSSANASIAQELVTNGDFSAGNTGFTSTYTWRTNSAPGSMYPENTYTVYWDPNYTHSNFWGRDHTTNNGNMMIINGSGTTPPPAVWQTVVNVQPNTDYYFSAWAISLNSVGPFANLQFKVNGVQVGTTTGPLPARPNNNNPPYNWKRFYGSWNSGSSTTATVTIIDLETAAGGNDFALDDISFGTLSTFITLISDPGTDDQTVCRNAAIENIVYNVGSGAAGPTVTGLPPGVTSSFNGVNLTLSGTPTANGVYTYTITTTGTCNPVSVNGTIRVQEEVITLSSAPATANQTVCLGSPVTQISYNLSGAATGASVTGLPSGVTGSLSGNTFTINGTPSSIGTYHYTVTTSGSCTPVMATGTIKINGPTIVRTSAAGTNTQTVCLNASIVNITYLVGGTATGATASGLPAGVTGSYSSNIFTIHGAPTEEGVFNYTVTTTGSCGVTNISGSITVKHQTITLISGVGTDAQSPCLNTSITDIAYLIGGSANDATVSGLPAGVTYSYSLGTLTISGTPTVAGSYTYTVTSSGDCDPASVNGSINVLTQSIALTSGNNNQTLCVNAPLSDIEYTLGGTATGASAIGLPPGVSGTYNSGVFTISGTPTTPGTYGYSITTTGTCSSTTLYGAINVFPGPVAGSIANVSVCYNSSGSLTLSGHSGTITGWEVSVDGGATWSSTGNTSAIQNFANAQQTAWYRANVSISGCSSVTTAVAKLGIHNLWVGVTSADWNTATNWSDDQLPNLSCSSVIIPVVTGPAVYPVLSSGTGVANDLVVRSGASLTVTNARLKVSGTITNNGSLNMTNGELELNGATAQSISGSYFTGKLLKSLIVSNNHGVSLTGTVSDTLKLTGTLSFGIGGAMFNTNDHLTLISNQSGTARVADLTANGLYSGNDISGNVTVERYIPNHPKAWQLLAVPTIGQTIKDAWQEGNTTLGNTKPGYGTTIAGNVPNALSMGFDFATSTASMKTYDPNMNQFVGVPSTLIPIANKKGYLLFVRGDRSVTTSTAPATAVTLRTTGHLYTTGANAPQVTTVAAGKFESIANPYASAIDFTKLNITGGVQTDVFYVWDPLLTTRIENGGTSPYGLGGYQTFYWNGSGFDVTPGGGSYSGSNTAIESGQAFLVRAPLTAGTVSFAETSKTDGGAMVNRVQGSPYAQLRTRMYVIQGANKILVDGNTAQFDESFSNDIDEHDAVKASNVGESLGLIRNNQQLAVERHNAINQNDTLFLNMGMVRAQQYQFEIAPTLMDQPGLTAFLEDSYLNTRTPVSLTDTTRYNFSVVNIAGAYAPNRFRIVFAKSPTVVLPVNFVHISANRNSDRTVSVHWKVENETSMKLYTVERSLNGSQFKGIITTEPMANNGGGFAYAETDQTAQYTDLYYRIKAQSLSGQIQYSPIAKVAGSVVRGGISVYPNPIKDNLAYLRLSGLDAGTYQINLIYSNGAVEKLPSLKLDGGVETRVIQLPAAVASGVYRLQLISAEGKTWIESIQVIK